MDQKSLSTTPAAAIRCPPQRPVIDGDPEPSRFFYRRSGDSAQDVEKYEGTLSAPYGVDGQYLQWHHQ
jgi:hypothetical protein